MLPRQQFHRVPIENSTSSGFSSLSGDSFAISRVTSGTSSTENHQIRANGRSHIKYSLAPTRGSDDESASASSSDSEADESALANARSSHSVWDVAWSLPAARSSFSRNVRSVSHTSSSTARVVPTALNEFSAHTADDSGIAPDSESRAPSNTPAPARAMHDSSLANANYPYPRQPPPDYSVNAANGNGNINGPSISRYATGSEPRAVSARLASARRKARAAGRRLKHWETFPGRDRFCCDGRLMQSKKPGAFYITLALVIIISALYFGFDVPWFWTRWPGGEAVAFIQAIADIFILSSLLRASFIDPGVIPRARPDEAARIEVEIERQVAEQQAAALNGVPLIVPRVPPRVREICIRGLTIKVKYCFTCKMFRPPRASHCSTCDNCVDRFDHHCPWVGNCVGRRNYASFYMFIFSLSLDSFFILATGITHLVISSLDHNSFFDALKYTPPTLINIGVSFIALCSVISLCGFHTYLIALDRSTNEDIKVSSSLRNRADTDPQNPFSSGSMILNCCKLLCSSPYPSTLRLREEDSDDDDLAEVLAAESASASATNGVGVDGGVALSRFATREEETLERDQRKLLRLMRKYGFDVPPAASEATSVSVSTGPDARFLPRRDLMRHTASHDDSSTFPPGSSVRSHALDGASLYSGSNHNNINPGAPPANPHSKSANTPDGDGDGGGIGFVNPLAETPVHRATANTPADASPTALAVDLEYPPLSASLTSNSMIALQPLTQSNLETVSSSTSSTAPFLATSTDLLVSPISNSSAAVAAVPLPALLPSTDSAYHSTPSGVPGQIGSYPGQSTNPHA